MQEEKRQIRRVLVRDGSIVERIRAVEAKLKF